jgi:type II secretory pathway pseudopilin PulG
LCRQSSGGVATSCCKSEIINHKSEIINRPAFTLLEVILALSLSTIVIGAIGLGIFVYYRAFDSGRDEVEEAQLARALLNRIADDIRGAVPYCPMDAESLVPQASSATSKSTTDAAKTAAEEAGVDTAGLEEELGSISSTTQNLATSVVPPSIPGLYGNDSVLLVDVSHLPRLDQYDAMAIASGEAAMPDQLSDVKTVTYFVNNPGLGSPVGGMPAADVPGDQQSGLVRRELDRAVAVWSEQQGSAAFPPPLAPEVGRITFNYFDGSQWTNEWDTVSMGMLPVAVRVEIAMIPRPKKGLLSSGNNEPFVEDPKHIYSMVVFLPSSQAARANPVPASTEESTDESGDTSGTSSGTGSSTSGSGTGGTGSGSGGASKRGG